jgi:hypothetical protein
VFPPCVRRVYVAHCVLILSVADVVSLRCFHTDLFVRASLYSLVGLLPSLVDLAGFARGTSQRHTFICPLWRSTHGV